MSNRDSKWTMIYHDATEKGVFSYIRLVPGDMNLEEVGFPHGISITGNKFSSDEEAEKMADRVDMFMENMVQNMGPDVFDIVLSTDTEQMEKGSSEDVKEISARYCLNPWEVYHYFIERNINLLDVNIENETFAILRTSHGNMCLCYVGTGKDSEPFNALYKLIGKIMDKIPPVVSWG